MWRKREMCWSQPDKEEGAKGEWAIRAATTDSGVAWLGCGWGGVSGNEEEEEDGAGYSGRDAGK